VREKLRINEHRRNRSWRVHAEVLKVLIMKHQSTICAAVIALCTLLGTVTVSALPVSADTFNNPFSNSYARSDQVYARSDQDDARDAVRSGRVISLEQALAVVRAEYPGRLLDAGFNRRAGVYNVKILSRGEVVLVAVNAHDGKIMNVRKGGR